LFGGAGAIGPALQSVGYTSGYYLFSAAPYVLTLAILVASSSATRASAAMPAELAVAR
jgi:simple sugar transport system permease protein